MTTTTTYECNDCHQRFEPNDDCIIGIHAQDDCSPFARMIYICSTCAEGYERGCEHHDGDESNE